MYRVRYLAHQAPRAGQFCRDTSARSLAPAVPDLPTINAPAEPLTGRFSGRRRRLRCACVR